MPTLQINIISDQTIPNILFIKQFEAATNRFLFISTAKMNQNGQLQAVMDVCGLAKNSCEVLTVSEESLADVESKLEAFQLPHTDKYIVNITGGTKIMSIGVYDFFSRRNSEIYYIPIGTNQYKRIFPRANEQTEALTYRVKLYEYLEGYGVSIANSSHINNLVQPPSVTTRLLNTPHYKISQPINALRRYISDTQAVGVWVGHLPLNSLPASLSLLPSMLQHLGFIPQTPDVLNGNEVNYLLGQWAEEYVYAFVKQTFNLDDCFIGNSVEINKGGVANELDVIFTFNNTLYVIECKTGLTKAIFDQTAYKLNAIRKEFGLFVKSAIVCLNTYNDSTGRLKLFDIKLFDGTVSKNRTIFETELRKFIK